MWPIKKKNIYMSVSSNEIAIVPPTIFEICLVECKRVLLRLNLKYIEKELKKVKGITNISEKTLNFYLTLIDEWTKSSSDAKYLGCMKNKLGDIVVILYKYNTIYLMGETYRTIMYAPKIMFHKVDNGHLHIDDVLTRYNNIGNGSILMESFLKYASENGFDLITGDLSIIDEDHKDRRNHFYEKFGFEVGDKIIKKIMGKENNGKKKTENN